MPILSTVNENDNFRPSDYFIQDASYLRLKNLQLGFNLPAEVCKKMRISDCRLWIGATNLATFTRYIGIDPEVGAQEVYTLYAEGWDSNTFPFSRQFLLGINVSF